MHVAIIIIKTFLSQGLVVIIVTIPIMGHANFVLTTLVVETV